MKRSLASSQACVIAALFAMLVSRISRADGGVVLLHKDQEPFSVTVFVSPEAAREGLTDVSVLVQTRKSGEIVLDAVVSLSIDPPAGLALAGSEPFCSVSPSAPAFQLSEMRHPQATVPATRAQASNKLLYAAALKLNLAGDWRLHVNVSRGPDTARFDCLLPVAPPSAKPSPLWPYLFLPPIAIAAFAMNQRLRRNSLERPLDANLSPFAQSQTAASGWACQKSLQRGISNSSAGPMVISPP